jgi:hypothetical protein
MKRPPLRKIPKAERISRVLRQRVAYDRILPRAIERENRLRLLMGLPARQEGHPR